MTQEVWLLKAAHALVLDQQLAHGVLVSHLCILQPVMVFRFWLQKEVCQLLENFSGFDLL